MNATEKTYQQKKGREKGCSLKSVIVEGRVDTCAYIYLFPSEQRLLLQITRKKSHG
jgi:hypothetical protein